ncbi:MAG: hypothetical protein KC505_08865 [Myxococcales bacterium]|nr:hypothetical protein [Myxococcales bacterium]USN51043.1 MAG: hypothetical protein H6731_01125 [Myxococcales bacterium]
MNKLFLMTVMLIVGFESSAKEIYQWYRDLNDRPGATLDEYSISKLLPKEFLIRMGLRDFGPFKLVADKLKANGKEKEWGTQVVQEVGQDGVSRTKLVLPNIVRTNFYMPAPGMEREVYSSGFDNFDNPYPLTKLGVLKDMGYVARITMSHKKPDKILRFYEKLTSLNPPIKNAYGRSVCRKNKSPVDQTKIPYGLWRLGQAFKQNRIFLVEGESTALTLWYHGYPALAFGGASKWHDNYMKYLKGIKDIYVLMEPDTGGKVLLDCMRNISIEDQPDYQDFAKRVKLVVLGGYGDASDLHLNIFRNQADPKDLSLLKNTQKEEQFKKILEKYIDEGVGLTDPGYFGANKDKGLPPRKISAPYNPSNRYKELKGKKYTEDVGEGILSGKPKANSKNKEVYTKYEIIPSATLQDYSRKKNISVSELIRQGFADGIFPHQKYGPIFGVKMNAYTLPAGSNNPDERRVDYFRFRTSMDSAQGSTDRFPNFLFNENGTLRESQKRIIYGLEYLPLYEALDSVYFVEGESDTLTMRHYGIAALAIPGTLEFSEKLVSPLKDVGKIIVVLEDDSGGEHGMHNLVNSSLADKILFIDFSTSGKDPSDMHTELTKDIKVDLESFDNDDAYKSQREKIQSEFTNYLAEALRRSVYWRDIKGFFGQYMEKRQQFDKEQEAIRQAMSKQKMTADRDGKCDLGRVNDFCDTADKNDATIAKICQPEPRCLTAQDFNMLFESWPHVDFYNAFTGKGIKNYFDENGEVRELRFE